MPRLTATPFLATVALIVPLVAYASCMGPYPPSMVKAFNQNCARDASMMNFCSCMMEQVQKNIPLSDFIEIGNSPGGINQDPRFVAASRQCAASLPAGGTASSSPAKPVSGSSSPSHSPALIR